MPPDRPSSRSRTAGRRRVFGRIASRRRPTRRESPGVECRIVRIDFGDVVVDTRTRELTRAGQPVPLSPKAFELLLLLIASRPQALSKQALQERLWPDTFVVEKNLANLVAEIRRALGDTSSSPRFIRTVQRFGYALRDAPRPSAPDPGVIRLTWRGGEATLGEGEHIVGRTPEAAVCLDGESVSRRHASITVTGASVTIADLGSKNGTAIGSRRITTAAPIGHGDRLRIGAIVLTVHRAGAADSTRTASSHASSASRSSG
jgi:DNA-binding winged helix-turn-helix (wHTH) protein